jgi:hypothetical protein
MRESTETNVGRVRSYGCFGLVFISLEPWRYYRQANMLQRLLHTCVIIGNQLLMLCRTAANNAGLQTRVMLNLATYF